MADNHCEFMYFENTVKIRGLAIIQKPMLLVSLFRRSFFIADDF